MLISYKLKRAPIIQAIGVFNFHFFQIEKWVKLVAQKMNKMSQIIDKDLKDIAMIFCNGIVHCVL